jgi:N-acetylmuramoyl-L-alanine amidase
LVPLCLAAFNVSLADSLKTEPKPGTRKVNQEPEKTAHAYRVRTVVIDAGHGGHDPGCLGASSREKHLALAISLRVAEQLREAFPELRVILTRDKDVFVPLHERAAIANRNQADLFISIHCNFMPKLDWVHGSETYVMGLHTAEHNLQVAKRENSAILLEADYEQNYDYDPNSPEGHIMLSMFQNAYLEQSIRFAERVEANFEQVAQRNSRGVKQAGFVVLKETAMPSVLVETGFLSNRDEEAFLKDAAGQDQVARVIARAFAEYKEEIEFDAVAGEPEPKPEPPAPEPEPILPELRPAPAADSVKAEEQRPVALAQTLPAGEGPEAERAAVERTPAPAGEPPSMAKAPEKEDPAEAAPRPVEPARPKAVAHKPAARTLKTTPYRIAQPSVPTSPVMPSPLLEAEARPETAAEASLPALSPPDPDHSSQRAVASPPSPDSSPTAKLHYRVQIAASPEPLLVTDERWGHISRPVELVEEDRLYKYQMCGAGSLKEAVALRRQLQRAGFMDAFVVIYRGAARISLEEARRWTAQP